MEPTILNPQGMTPKEPGKHLTASVVGALAVIAAVALGALYFFGASATPLMQETYMIDSMPTTPASALEEGDTWMPPSSQSDEASAIQAELEATSMRDFEALMGSDASAAASGI